MVDYCSDTILSGKGLYVDILNYGGNIFPINEKWSFKRAFGKIQSFVAAATRSNWRLKAFIDESAMTSEARNKWKSRRSREVRKGYRTVPQGMTVLLGDMLRKCGVEVCYSKAADNDDTIALHAHADGADILSQDKDMFRYTGSSFTVYVDWTVTADGKLLLHRHQLHRQLESGGAGPKVSKRSLGPPPEYQSRVTHFSTASVVNPFTDGAEMNCYLRGAPSPLVRALGYNPHAVVARLRQGLYHRLGMHGPITEEWPEWAVEATPTTAAVAADDELEISMRSMKITDADPDGLCKVPVAGSDSGVDGGVSGGGAVIWVSRRDVTPCGDDVETLRLLDAPMEALRVYFPFEMHHMTYPSAAVPVITHPAGRGTLRVSAQDWFKHICGVAAVVFELSVMANPEGPSLLDLMCRFEDDYHAAKRRAGAAHFNSAGKPKYTKKK